MAKIMIVGSGVVGQATGKGLIKKGHEVVFVDISVETVRRLSQEGFEARLPDELGDIAAEISMFCVSTPPKGDGSVNLDYITTAIANHGEWLKRRGERERTLGTWWLLEARFHQELPEKFCFRYLRNIRA